MGGITGFIDHNHSISRANLKEASSTLSNRGGNGSGFIFHQLPHYTLGIAHERLATIDLSQNSCQPFTTTCGNYSITFNGTIYNYLILRESLIRYGVIFKTLSDTEVILECYKKWGYKAFGMLDGSYAFVIVDRKLNQLLITRDQLGTKQLYYYKDKGIYIFASECRALLTYPNVEKEINKTALANYFKFGYFTGEDTIYQNIYKFKKGILTTIDIHSGNSYDSPLVLEKTKQIDRSAATEEQVLNKIEDFLTESILKRNIANVPTGVLLSGGYDTATIAAILQKNQTKRIKTFTIGFNNKKFDDGPQARKIADHLKTNHTEIYLSAERALEIIKDIPNIFDEPIGNSGVIPLTFLAKELHQDIKVLMGSEGGDELFSGSRSYNKVIALNSLSNKEKNNIFNSLLINLLKKINVKTKAILEADGLLNKHLENNACFTSEEVSKLCNISYSLAPTGLASKITSIKDLLIYDIENYLIENITPKNDKSFVNLGIDYRDSLLSTTILSYFKSLNENWFTIVGQQEFLLKKILHKYIPKDLMGEPKKGFVVPLVSWLKTILKPLVNEYISEAKLNQHQLLNVQEALKIKAAFYRNSTVYNAQKLWLILQFQLWYQKWMT